MLSVWGSIKIWNGGAVNDCVTCECNPNQQKKHTKLLQIISGQETNKFTNQEAPHSLRTSHPSRIIRSVSSYSLVVSLIRFFIDPSNSVFSFSNVSLTVSQFLFLNVSVAHFVLISLPSCFSIFLVAFSSFSICPSQGFVMMYCFPFECKYNSVIVVPRCPWHGC